MSSFLKIVILSEHFRFSLEFNLTLPTSDRSYFSDLKNNVAVDTYHDHRMAMAFAPLALKIAFKINEADVVSKSYPDFWNDLKKIGFSIRVD